MKLEDRNHFVWAPWVALVIALAIFGGYYYFVVTDWMMDDAFISFRYSKHFAEGYGLVYNPGEDPVEGYSNFLWTFLLGLGAMADFGIVWLARVLGAAAAVLTLLLAANAHRFIKHMTPLASALAVLFLATSAVFLPWPTSGMETTLFGLLILLALLVHVRSLRPESGAGWLVLLGVVAACAAMTRPEGVLVTGLVLFDQGIESFRRRDRRVLYVLAAFAVLYAPWFVWRFIYYGYPAPNTYYAKVGMTEAQVQRGIRYVRKFGWIGLGVIIPAALAVLAPQVWWKRFTRYWALPLFAAGYTAYIVLVGGDGLPAFRFFAPLIPVLCLLAAAGVVGVFRFPQLALIAGSVVVSFNLYQMFTHEYVYERVKHGDSVQKRGAAVGKWLKRHAPPDTVIATNTAGTIPYYSELATIDMLGLNDEHIAHREIPNMGRRQAGHEKGDGQYVLARRPDYIQLGSASGSRKPYSFVGDRELFKDPDFHKHYEYKRFPVPGSRAVGLYIRKDKPELEQALRGTKPPNGPQVTRPQNGKPLASLADRFRAAREKRREAIRRAAEQRAGKDAKAKAPPKPPERPDNTPPEIPKWAQRTDRGEESAMGPGRWRPYRTHQFDEELTDEQRETMAQLEAIGYLGGSTLANGKQRSGVTIHEQESAWQGLNFYTSGHAAEAYLVDMNGRVLHGWKKDFWEVWPDYPTSRRNENTQFWRRAHLYENGDILAIYEGMGIVKLDKDSNLLWANPGKAHHDLEVMPNGDIYVLTREAHVIPRVNKTRPVLEDFISVLGPDGEEKKRVSLLECLENSEAYRVFWTQSRKRTGDLFHTNTLEILDGRIADRMSAFRKGNILTSFLILDVIAVVDLDKEEVVWARRGDWNAQHDPKILDNGNLMLFDNRGNHMASTVYEFDPVTMKPVWYYRGSKEAPFFSRTCGAAQRLPNGNTLVTESDVGRAFEVTKAKQTVWEFINPHRAGPDNEYIGTLFEVLRLPEDFPTAWCDSPHGDITP